MTPIEIEEQEMDIREAYKLQNYSKCLKLLKQAPDSVKNSTRYKILQASCLNHLGEDYSLAHNILNDVIRCEPLNAFAYHAKGLVFVSEGELEFSIECFDKALAIDQSEKMNKAREMKFRAQTMLKSIQMEKIRKNRKVVQTSGQRAVVSPEVKLVVTEVKSLAKESPEEPKNQENSDCPTCFKSFATCYR